MGYRNKTYVIFDGEEDMNVYRMMCAWKHNKHIDFDFYDAHELRPLMATAEENAVKIALRHRLQNTKQAIVIVGEKTKFLYKFVRWEIETCLEMGLPIVAVNLNGKRSMDPDRCPPILRETCTIHVPLRSSIIMRALDEFSDNFAAHKARNLRDAYFNDDVYKSLSL